MSAVTFETLLRVAFGERYDDYFSDAETTAYTSFDRLAGRGRAQPEEPSPQLSFAFERVRLGVAMAILQLLADVTADDYDSTDDQPANTTTAEAEAALQVLHRAMREARSPQDIDGIISQEAATFERLYTDLYVDDAGEQLLLLFERTLAADTRRELDRCLRDAATLAEELAGEEE